MLFRADMLKRDSLSGSLRGKKSSACSKTYWKRIFKEWRLLPDRVKDNYIVRSDLSKDLAAAARMQVRELRKHDVLPIALGLGTLGDIPDAASSGAHKFFERLDSGTTQALLDGVDSESDNIMDVDSRSHLMDIDSDTVQALLDDLDSESDNIMDVDSGTTPALLDASMDVSIDAVVAKDSPCDMAYDLLALGNFPPAQTLCPFQGVCLRCGPTCHTHPPMNPCFLGEQTSHSQVSNSLVPATRELDVDTVARTLEQVTLTKCTSQFADEVSQAAKHSRSFPSGKVKYSSQCGPSCDHVTADTELKLYHEVLSYLEKLAASCNMYGKKHLSSTAEDADVPLAFEVYDRRDGVVVLKSVRWVLLATASGRAGRIEARQNLIEFEVLSGYVHGECLSFSGNIRLRLAREPFVQPMSRKRPEQPRKLFSPLSDAKVGTLREFTEKEWSAELTKTIEEPVVEVKIWRLQGRWELKHDFDTYIISNVVHDVHNPHRVFMPADSDEETDYIKSESVDAVEEDALPIPDGAEGDWLEEELSALLHDGPLEKAVAEIIEMLDKEPDQESSPEVPAASCLVPLADAANFLRSKAFAISTEAMCAALGVKNNHMKCFVVTLRPDMILNSVAGHIKPFGKTKKATCSRHGSKCKLMMNPDGHDERVENVLIAWLCLAWSTTMDEHQVHAESMKKWGKPGGEPVA